MGYTSSLYIQLSFLYRSIIRVFSLFLFSIGLTLSTSHAQESTSKTAVIKYEGYSAQELLKEAKSLRDKDKKTTIALANQALRLAEDQSKYSLIAQAHNLLGKMSLASKNREQALFHFLKASSAYKNLNDAGRYITSSIDYIEVLLADKRYNEAGKLLDELLPVAKQNGEDWPIALTYITQGDKSYQQKNYEPAITQYMNALQYLMEDDKETQEHLGEAYKKIAQTYKRLKNTEQTALFYKRALNVYTALRDKKSMARTLNTLAEAERSLGNLVVALDYSIRCLEIHKDIDDPKGRAKALGAAGIIYRNIGRYEKSLKHIYEAHLYYKKVNDISGIAKSANQMGLIYTRLKEFDQAKSFYELIMSLPEKEVEVTALASAYREMAVIELNSDDYDSAITMAEKAQKIYQRENEKAKEALISRIIANIYNAQKNNQKAIAYYRESIALAKQTNSTIYQIKAQTPLGSLLIEKDPEESVSLLKVSLALSNQIKNKSEMLNAYRALRKAEKSRGNYDDSLSYAEKEIELTKVIQQEREENKLVLARANLHSHKMEIELESLREKAKFNQLEIAKKNNEIEIAEQSRTINELKLIKNKYASLALTSLLVVSLFLVIYTYRRFIASKKRNKELDYLATHDPLTGSYNRRILFEQLNKDFSKIELLDQYCIIMADIDHFKAVNDTYGHSVGDSVLRGVAGVFQNCVRENDITARYGGEEFCIILPKTPQEQALRIAETMRKKVELNQFDNINVTCSFGVSSILFGAQEPEAIINQADLALYKSKADGRNQVTLWEHSLE